jgi:AMMECR1 domain-containing protein
MPELPESVDRTLLCDQAGVFVCIKRGGRLRGCIGTIEPVNNCLAEEILHNAVSAERAILVFRVYLKAELPELQYTVDVLTKPEKVETTAALDVRRYD